jgi:phage/plasmid-associated DNA primase
VAATAKYKDPSSFIPQCLLVFCTNSDPVFPPNDGGLRSRVSYLNMPFEWVENAKERVIKSLQAEFLFGRASSCRGCSRRAA